ncbi:uncharacterized protein LOC114329853 [Diabrotica virgifera virgifera]|uniref:Uncharacterized protein n=1 Tax=Diabrotica virgifera virgifera TaxID=50390 RepID=A0ABM5IKI3_DIAVI|nr:uncharacterized protein LOC114329853 [Diabrotica virgifera virgifera]
MLGFVLCLVAILAIACAKDPFDYDLETCVKIFYSTEDTYSIYCLKFLENHESLGIITDHNDTILFKQVSDQSDESKICVNVHNIQTSEKYCIGLLSRNCLSLQEDPKKGFTKTPEDVPCKEFHLGDAPFYCIGFSNADFTLVFYCEPNIYYHPRRTILYIPDNKPPKRE